MYFSELRINWQSLMAGAIGMALGSALGHYTLSLFGPALIADLGWSKAEFALIGSVPLATMLLIPVAGRFVDRFGPRLAVTVGFIAVPLGFVAMSLMSGNLIEYFALYLAQHVFGILTTSMVFCRVIVERFDLARGIALSMIMSAPPLAGAIAAPIMADIINTEGWRAGYLAMAAATAFGGVVSISLMGRAKRRSAPRPAVVKLSRAEFVSLIRNPVMLLLICGMLLVNLPQQFAASQLKLIALDNGVSDGSATAMVSLYAVGVIIGRFLTGVALDAKIRPHMVAIVALGLPAVGYGLFASGTAVASILMGGVLLVGLAQGAESDIGAYLISRRFGLANFSLLLSLLTMSIGIGSALGSLVLSYTLYLSDSYVPYLILSAVGTLLGAVAFGLTGARRWIIHEPREAQDAVLEQAIAGELS